MRVCYSQAGVFLGYKMPVFARRLVIPSENCSISVILVLYLNLDHLRLHDVDPLCLPADRSSYRMCVGLFLHQTIYVVKIDK